MFTFLSIYLPISVNHDFLYYTISMAARIFRSCQDQNHEILRDEETCYACQSPPWRAPGGVPALGRSAVVPPTPSASSVSSSEIRRPQYPQVMQTPDTAIFTPTASNPPSLGLASHLINPTRRGTAQQRGRTRNPTPATLPSYQQSQAAYPALPTYQQSAPSLAPSAIDQRILFIGAIATGQWLDDGNIREASYQPIKDLIKLTIPASDKVDYTQFYWKFLFAARRSRIALLNAATYPTGRGQWAIAANHVHDPTSKKPEKSLLWITEWTDLRTITSIIHTEAWETAKDQGNRHLPATSYPITICWTPDHDQLGDVDRNQREETAFSIDGEIFTFNRRIPSSSPQFEIPPPLPVERASTPHRRGISEVTARPEREEQDRQERPTQRPDLEREEQGTQEAIPDQAGPLRRSHRHRRAPVRED